MRSATGIGALSTLQGQCRQRAADLVFVFHLPLRPPVAAFCFQLAVCRGSNGGVAGNSFRNLCRLLDCDSGLPPARSTKELRKPQAARAS